MGRHGAYSGRAIVFRTAQTLSWLATNPRTGLTIRVFAARSGTAKRLAADEFTLRANGTEPDVLAREVLVIRDPAGARIAA